MNSHACCILERPCNRRYYDSGSGVSLLENPNVILVYRSLIGSTHMMVEKNFT